MAARSERSPAKPKNKAPEAVKATNKTPPKSPAKAPALASKPGPQPKPPTKPAPRAPIARSKGQASTPAPGPVKPAGKPAKAPVEVPKKASKIEPKGKTKPAKSKVEPAKGKAEPAKASRASRVDAPKKVEAARAPEVAPAKVAKGRGVEGKKAESKKASEKSGKSKRSKEAPEKSGKSKIKLPMPRPSRTLPMRAPTSRLPLRVVPPPKQYTLEERSRMVEERLGRTSEEFRRAYQENLYMAWVFHDALLEGVVYTSQELRVALDPAQAPVTDSSLQPVCEEIRRYREAILHCQDLATKKRQPVTTDTIKKIYLILHPEEGDLKSVKYRKEIPQHRMYFHEYAAPDKIGSKVRQVVDWVNDPETRKVRNVLRIAGRAHYDLLRAFPFPHDSGRVARLFMNMLLMRAGYPPAIIHSTDRQRYYEALKGSALIINNMVQEAIENALSSIEKLLDEYETRTRSFY
jgi:hypothetical protein